VWLLLQIKWNCVRVHLNLIHQKCVIECDVQFFIYNFCYITDCGSDGYFQGTGGTLKLERTGSGNYDCLWVVKTLPGYNAVRVIVKKFKASGKPVFIFQSYYLNTQHDFWYVGNTTLAVFSFLCPGHIFIDGHHLSATVLF